MSSSTSSSSQTSVPQITPSAPNLTKDSTVSFSHNLFVKLDEKNYLLWKQQILAAIQGHDLEEYIAGKDSIPKKFSFTEDELAEKLDPNYVKWKKQDKLILSWLLSFMTETMLTKVSECDHSYEVWQKVQHHFGINTKAKVHQYRAELRSAKKGTRSMSDLLLRIKAITDALRAVGSVVSEHEHIQCILEGLPSEYEAFVTSANMKSDLTSVCELEALLMAQEIRIEQNTKEVKTTDSASANVATVDAKDLVVVVLEVAEITEQQYNQNFSQLRQRSSGNMSAMVATPESVCDSAWFPDSGATSHVTSNPNNFMSSMQYSGPEQLHMGNGTGLNISRVGQSLVQSPFHSNISLQLNDLLLVPNITKNLGTNQILLSGSTRSDGLYFFDNFHLTHHPSSLPSSLQAKQFSATPTVLSSTVNSDVSTCTSVTPYTLWHCRLGHSNTVVVLNALKQCNVQISNKGRFDFCEACAKGKHHKLPSPPSPNVYRRPLELIYTDLWGPSPMKSRYEFSLKDLGNLHYFLGIEVTHLDDGSLLLSQGKYVHDLLCKTKMDGANFISTPMVSNSRLSKDGDNLMSDPTLYRSTVGALQYVTITRPDLSFAINKVCQFMSNPLDEHWAAVKRILRYLKEGKKYALYGCWSTDLGATSFVLSFCLFGTKRYEESKSRASAHYKSGTESKTIIIALQVILLESSSRNVNG
ncbi:retrovirus-related Pol polyprotein from transposon TNT 1-94 [Senna tora]|uniref:Retrovirus-related Pol polyprotein from transposon TNT 1-94 n=1 Tax=Senna tora TaxID=362788 RepID=A0A834WYN4_9FABA|nr:retrovirus-related Pol polyprotein from transposon TNT 1-94 [Senna tora]